MIRSWHKWLFVKEFCEQTSRKTNLLPYINLNISFLQNYYLPFSIADCLRSLMIMSTMCVKVVHVEPVKWLLQVYLEKERMGLLNTMNITCNSCGCSILYHFLKVRILLLDFIHPVFCSLFILLRVYQTKHLECRALSISFNSGVLFNDWTNARSISMSQAIIVTQHNKDTLADHTTALSTSVRFITTMLHCAAFDALSSDAPNILFRITSPKTWICKLCVAPYVYSSRERVYCPCT